MPTEFVYGIILIAAVAAGAIQTVTGFGAVVLLLLVLSQFFDLLTASAVNMLVCLFLTAALSWRYRKHIQFRLVLIPLIPYLVSSAIVNLFVDKIDLRILGILFGVFLLALGIYYLFLARHVKSRATLTEGLICGFVSGIMASLFGVGGPLLAVYLIGASESKESFAGNLQFVFLISNFLIFFTKFMKGFFHVSLIPITMVGVVGVLAGQWIGARFVHKLDPEKMKRIVYAFISVSGIITIIQNAV